MAEIIAKNSYEGLSQEDMEKAQKNLLNEASALIKGTNFNYVKFNNTFVYLNRKVTFRKVDEKSAQITIEGEGNDTTQMNVMVPEALEFFIDEIKAGNITEVIDYRKFINQTVISEGGHIKFTKTFNYSGREYTVTSITMPKDQRNGALVDYAQKGGGNRQDYILNMDEALLSEMVDVIKANNYL